MSMSYVAHQSAFHAQTALSPAAAAPARRSLWRWLYDAVMLSRQRQTERDIARLVSWRDGGFNDRFEQEIAERFYSIGSNAPR
jgi:hypothetical protein